MTYCLAKYILQNLQLEILNLSERFENRLLRGYYKADVLHVKIIVYFSVVYSEIEILSISNLYWYFLNIVSCVCKTKSNTYSRLCCINYIVLPIPLYYVKQKSLINVFNIG